MRARALAAVVACAALGACGGGGSDTLEREQPALVAALGDSITAGAPFWDPNPATRRRIIRRRLRLPVDRRNQYLYWAERRLGEGVRFRNCGVGGARTDQLAAFFDACARGATALIVQGGTNDVAQMRPVTAAARNLRAIVRRGKRLGLRVTLVDVIPLARPGTREPIRRLNALIRRIGKQEGVPVLAFSAALEDPRRPGLMRPDLTADGIHPSVKGHRRLGALIEAP